MRICRWILWLNSLTMKYLSFREGKCRFYSPKIKTQLTVLKQKSSHIRSEHCVSGTQTHVHLDLTQFLVNTWDTLKDMHVLPDGNQGSSNQQRPMKQSSAAEEYQQSRAVVRPTVSLLSRDGPWTQHVLHSWTTGNIIYHNPRAANSPIPTTLMFCQQ